MAAEAGGSSGDFVIPDALPVLPLRDAVVLPSTAVPLAVGQPRSVRLVDEVMRGNRLVALVLQRDAKAEASAPGDLHGIGTVGMIHQLMRAPDGSVRLMVQGIERIRLLDFVSTDPYLVARVEVSREQMGEDADIEGLRRAVVDIFRRLVEASPELPDELAVAAENVPDPLRLTYFVASVVPVDVAVRQELLEMNPVASKLRRLVDLLQKELAVRELGRKITTETEERLTKKQREYYLREQLRSIQRELGEEEGGGSEVADLRRRIDEAGLPEEAKREAERELSRLAGLSPASPEHGMIVTYLEWLAGLPWSKLDGGTIDIHRARQVLDEDHFDLEKVKDRILEYLAVKKLRQERSGQATQVGAGPTRVTGNDPAREPILCFVGPPGVGKTSLGQSIARALGRKFARMSLGGVRDEAEIRGHRRTYIGALPGRVIQALRRAETRDPVFMLDEIDKIGADWRGDPSSALLEVLDPAQNHTFVDNYLGVPFDLSQVLFIATANTLDTIPGPLRDRMEILTLSGYTDEEKVGIAREYLVPKQLMAHGIDPTELSFEPGAIRQIVRGYTREAGVRSLDREIAAVARKVARRHRGGPARARPHHRRQSRGIPRAAALLRRGGGAHHPAGRGHGSRLDARGRRCPVRRSHDDAEQRGASRPHRDARRRDARERPGRRVLRVVQRRGARHRSQDLREQDDPRARAGRGHPQGRTVGRGDHRDGPGVARHPSAGAKRPGHDGRDHPPGEGSSRWGDQGEGAGRASRGHPRGDPAPPKRTRYRGHTGGAPEGAALRAGRRRRGSSPPCPHARLGGRARCCEMKQRAMLRTPRARPAPRRDRGES